MQGINAELNNNLIEWSEGNEYLYSLLYTSWANGIRTAACCGGHVDRKDNEPYILFIVDEKNLPFFESMIGAAEDIPDISLSLNYRSGSNIPESDRIVLAVYCMMHNRMETFYKLTKSILEKHDIKTEKGRRFLISIIGFLHEDSAVFEQNIALGVPNASTFTTFTSERQAYINEKMKLLYPLKKKMFGSNSKYDINQITLDEKPQVEYKQR